MKLGKTIAATIATSLLFSASIMAQVDEEELYIAPYNFNQPAPDYSYMDSMSPYNFNQPAPDYSYIDTMAPYNFNQPEPDYSYIEKMAPYKF